MTARLAGPIARRREQALYLLFGGATTLLGVLSFWLLAERLGMGPLSANAVSWAACVAFAYVTNRAWVFGGKADTPAGIVRECAAFCAGRLGTLALEELVLWAGIALLGLADMAVKVFAQALVIVGNYAISKWLVFGDDGRQGS